MFILICCYALFHESEIHDCHSPLAEYARETYLTVDDINVNWIILIKILGSLGTESDTASR